MHVIILTGGIATGKSTVAKYLSQKYPIVDTDLIARQIVEPNTIGLAKIEEIFGKKVIQSDGTLNRAALGDIVFSDDKMRQKLNEITHPLIHQETKRQIELYRSQNQPLVIIDIPLFFEVGGSYSHNAVWLVYCNEAEQKRRLMARNQYTQLEADQRISSQMPIDDKVPLADIVIDNSGTIEETYQQIDVALKDVLG